MKIKVDDDVRKNIVTARFSDKEMKILRRGADIENRKIANYVWWFVVEGYKYKREVPNE